jgi:hypothetical protein
MASGPIKGIADLYTPKITTPSNATLKQRAFEILQSNGGSLYTMEGVTADTQQLPDQLDPTNSAKFATLGSTTSADTNDPQIAEGKSQAYFKTFNTANNNANSGTEPSLTPTKVEAWFDLEFTGSSLTSTTRAANGPIILVLGSDDALRAQFRIVGNSFPSVTAPSLDITTLSGRQMVLVTVDTAAEKVRFQIAPYTAVEPFTFSGWSYDQTVSTTAYSAGLEFGSSPIRAGGSSSVPSIDTMYRYLVKADDVLIRDFYPDRDAGTSQTSWVSETGETWAIERATSGQKAIVIKPNRSVLQSDGADDYIQLPASLTPAITATTGEATLVVLGRQHGDTASGGSLLDFRSSGTNGFEIRVLGTEGQVNARMRGTSATVSVNSPATDSWQGSIPTVAAAVINSGTLAVYDDVSGLSSPSSTTGSGS